MPCKKDTTKKYATRNGPPYHAKDCKGIVKVGNDGVKYISSADKNGVYKWIKKTINANKTVTNKTIKDTNIKSYDIHNNGFVPFIVNVSPKTKTIKVFENKLNKKIVLDIKYKNIFIGDNLLNDSKYKKKGKGSEGNSILVEVSKHNYIYIGSEIYSFETNEDIKSYYSPIGNADVPYPYAFGDKLAYFMLDKKTVPCELINSKKDGYGQFYGYINMNESIKKKIQEEQKSFSVKKL